MTGIEFLTDEMGQKTAAVIELNTHKALWEDVEDIQTVGAFAKMLRDYSGSEPTDPAKVAKVVLKLANQEDAPLRLLHGTDAVQYASAAAKALAESDSKWRDLSDDRRDQHRLGGQLQAVLMSLLSQLDGTAAR